MPDAPHTAFISYSREDSEFTLRLARDLKAAGASVWIDQLDIGAGVHWDNAIEDALLEAPQMLVVLSPASSHSANVRNEISFALEQGKIVVPVIYKDCIVPLQLQRQNRIDFRADYTRGLSALLDHLGVMHPNQAVLAQAQEEETARKAAWQARGAEARRLADLAERKHREDEKQNAERKAIEEADHKTAHQGPREVAGDRKTRELDEQLKEEGTERRTRDLAEHGPHAGVGEARERGAHNFSDSVLSSYAEPERRYWNRGLLTAVTVTALLAIGVFIFTHDWRRMKWTPLKSGTQASLRAITGTSDGKILFACGPLEHYVPNRGYLTTTVTLKSVDGSVSWTKLNVDDGPECQDSVLSSSDGSHLWSPGLWYRIWASSNGGASWEAAPSKFNGPSNGELRSIFRTADGQRLWIVGRAPQCFNRIPVG